MMCLAPNRRLVNREALAENCALTRSSSSRRSSAAQTARDRRPSAGHPRVSRRPVRGQDEASQLICGWCRGRGKRVLDFARVTRRQDGVARRRRGAERIGRGIAICGRTASRARKTLAVARAARAHRAGPPTAAPSASELSRGADRCAVLGFGTLRRDPDIR